MALVIVVLVEDAGDTSNTQSAIVDDASKSKVENVGRNPWG